MSDPTRRRPCDKCHGTGRYSWGACVNGRMTHSGPCFQCLGKGYTTLSDRKRTDAYWRHRMLSEFRGH